MVREPDIVRAFVEVTRYDNIKYEVDPESGYLRIDRPQRNSCLPPAPYGFVPRTLCGTHTSELVAPGAPGDGDPLDICVLSEHHFNRSEILLDARIVGGFRLVDEEAADPKIIAILDNDLFLQNVRDLDELPGHHIDKLEHYFREYKAESNLDNPVRFIDRCSRDEAIALLAASLRDYQENFDF